MNEQDLLDLKKKVEKAKNETAELNGQKTVLMKQLKTDYTCSSIDKAKEKIETLNEELETIQEQIDKKIKEIEEKYQLEE